jgi:hypothetical protein
MVHFQPDSLRSQERVPATRGASGRAEDEPGRGAEPFSRRPRLASLLWFFIGCFLYFLNGICRERAAATTGRLGEEKQEREAAGLKLKPPGEAILSS